MTVLMLALLLQAVPASAATNIRSDETVLFLNTAARVSPDGSQWVIPIHAWIFEKEEHSLWRKATLEGAAMSLGLAPSPKRSAEFKKRVAPFVHDNERGKYIVTSLSPQQLGPSAPNGHLYGEIRLPRKAGEGKKRFSFTAVLPPGDKRVFKGTALMTPEKGLIVVSDIDDTVKISEVNNKQALLKNTFERPYRAVEGMSEAYQKLKKSGAILHYVSDSPWQLYAPLRKFLKDAGFPSAVFHLKNFRLKDSSFFSLFDSPMESKPPQIERLLIDFPKHEFILIGDSGQKDPEVYGEIARKYQGRIRHIYIRRVTSEKERNPRYFSAFHGLKPSLWTVFDDPQVIKAE